MKAYARRVGLNAADFSGHSLRSGFLTSAAAKGASVFKMMDVSRHKSIDTLRSLFAMLRYFAITREMGCCNLLARLMLSLQLRLICSNERTDVI